MPKMRRALISSASVWIAFCALVACGTKNATQVRPYHVPPPLSPTIQACVDAHRPVCNPTAYATFVASDPLARPPSAHPVYISRRQAIAEAHRYATDQSTRVFKIRARLMLRREFESLDKSWTLHNQERKVWVVTVYANVPDMRTSKLAHYYTVAIDAETGIISDIAFERALAG